MSRRVRALESALAVKSVEAWNLAHPVGTPVRVQRDGGETLETVTRSAAQVLGGTAVVWVAGIAGCYALDRITPLGVPTGAVA